MKETSKKNLNKLLGITVLILILAWSCGSSETGANWDVADYERQKDVDNSSIVLEDLPSIEAQSPGSASRLGAISADGSVNFFADTGETAPEENVRERIKVLNGYIELEVSDTEVSKDRIRDYVQELGGFIEQSYSGYLSLRVPAVDFNEAFNWILSQGKVLVDEIQSFDVTDFFQDLDSRLQIATDTRNRLYQLLAATADVEERVKILREIRRLSEEIESINLSLTQITQAVSFSRIDIYLYSALQSNQTNELSIPFPWIRNLRPGQQSIRELNQSINLDLGDQFAVFSDGGDQGYYAESATGVRVRIGSLENQPKGDQDFWYTALEYHLSKLFSKAEPNIISSELQGLTFTSFDFEPYLYSVFISVIEDQILVFEVYYPSSEQFNELNQVISEAIKGAVK